MISFIKKILLLPAACVLPLLTGCNNCPSTVVLFTADHSQYPIINTSFEGLETRRCQSPISARNAENIAITGHGTFDGNGDTWRPTQKDKLTEGQWKKLVSSGGVVDPDGRIWYPSEGALKGDMLPKDNFNVPRGTLTDADWDYMRDWLRPVLLSFIKCNKVLLEGATFKNSPSWCLHLLSCKNITINKVTVSNPWYSQNRKGSMTLPGGTFPLNPPLPGEKLRNPCLNRIK